tara:strand:- start:1259 stop:2467 length:1209 start_codon:yes stop_codon:yes gene_type:complete
MSSKIATELATSMFANGKWCLAPMVRCGTLPLRLLSLKYGASTVWGPEIIDHKLPQCTRIENTKLGTVDFLMPNGSLCFRTKRSLEKGKLVFQLGSSSKESAIKGAEVIAKDVDALDINMGCPKSFSIKGGMGAALLKKADVACDIISGLKAKFPDMPITCKIRLLDTTEETVNFCKSLEKAGAYAISIHARSEKERPKDPARWVEIKPIVNAVNIPVLANGDLYSHEDVENVMKETGVSSVMIARGALKNTSMFKRDGQLLDLHTICQDYIRFCIETEAHPINCKYVLQYMLRMNGMLKADIGVKLTSKKTRSMQKIADLFDVNDIEISNEPNPIVANPNKHKRKKVHHPNDYKHMKNRKNKKDNKGKDKVREEEKEKIVFPPTDQKYDDDYLVNKPKNEL